MPKCNACGIKYIEGALYCNECGIFLLADHEARESKSIEKVPDEKPVNGSKLTLTFEGRRDFGTQANRVLFMITSSGRKVALELEKEIRIGREDPSEEIWPDLDLTPDQGFECGVSRCHARLQTSSDGIELVDLGSKNGTQLNNQPLDPKQPHPLKNGDEIQLGELLLQVFFESEAQS